jgi:positive regulator of sigma E activity
MMLCQTGTVIEINETRAHVEFEPAPACGGCASGRGCGLGPLLALFGHARQVFQLDLHVVRGDHLRIGDRVRAGVTPGELLKGVGLAYLLPITSVLSGAWLAGALFPASGDPAAVAGAIIGMAAGWLGLAARGDLAEVVLLH